MRDFDQSGRSMAVAVLTAQEGVEPRITGIDGAQTIRIDYQWGVLLGASEHRKGGLAPGA